MPTRPALSAMRWADTSLEGGRQAPATVLGEEVDSPNLEPLGFAVNLSPPETSADGGGRRE